MPAPANDDFANATVISGASGTAGPVTIDDATTEVSEPLVGLGGFRQSVWYSWTAPVSGAVLVFLHPELGSISGIFAGWSGVGYGSLTNLGPGPFSASPVSSGAEGAVLLFNAIGGTTYHFQVGASDSGTPAIGTVEIRWEMVDPPANDDFIDALHLTSNVAVGPIDSVAATVEASEPSPSVMDGSGPYQTTWYEWTADADAEIVLDLAGSVGDEGGGFNEWIAAVYKTIGSGNVIEVDATAADAYTEIDLGSDQSEVWVTFDLGLSPTTIVSYCMNAIVSLWDSSANFATGAGFIEGAYPCGYGGSPCCWSDDAANNYGSVPLPQVGQRCELHYKSDGSFEFYVNGILVMSDAGTPWPTASVRHVLFGLKPLVGPVPDAVFLFDNIMIGTARGIGDLFTNSGSLVGWTSTVGALSVISHPWWMLQELASADLIGSTTLTFDAIAGTTYMIQVGTWGGYYTATVRLVLIGPGPPFTGRVFADLPVRTFVTDIDSRTLSILDRGATDKQFLYVLNGPAYHTAQAASDDNEINRPFPDPDSPANLTNNRRLIFALQRWQGYDPPYQPIFGGILMTPEDQGADTPTTRYAAYDGWQYMMSRPVRNPDTGELPGPNGLTFPAGTLASDLALSFLEITELIDGETHIDWSDAGLIEASDPLPSEITFDASLSLGEAWQQLCNTGTIDIHLDPMYEPISAPGKINRFRVVAQSAGTAAGPVRHDIVMGWDRGGRSLMGVNRLIDGTRLANRVQYFEGQNGQPAPLQSDAASIAANGEYWAQQFFPGSNDITIVALLAVTELAIRRNGAPSIALDPAPERVEIPLRDWGLGDYLPVWASRNLREPLGIDYAAFDPDNPGASGYQRVYAIPLAVDDNGVPRVTGVLTSKEN